MTKGEIFFVTATSVDSDRAVKLSDETGWTNVPNRINEYPKPNKWICETECEKCIIESPKIDRYPPTTCIIEFFTSCRPTWRTVLQTQVDAGHGMLMLMRDAWGRRRVETEEMVQGMDLFFPANDVSRSFDMYLILCTVKYITDVHPFRVLLLRACSSNGPADGLVSQ